MRTIIEADPNHTDEIRRVAGEPAITRRSRLTGDIELESARANWRSRAAVDHILHERGHHVSDLRTYNFNFLSGRLRDSGTVAGRNAIDCNGSGPRAIRCEGCVRRCNLQRRRFGRSERHRRVGAWHPRESGFRRQAHNSPDRHFHSDIDCDYVQAMDYRVTQCDGLH